MLNHADLEFLQKAEFSSRPVMIISPHPDDEVIGAGSRLPWLTQAVVVQITDGSPNNLADARENGFQTREEYARARREELASALAAAGHFETVHLDIPDQEVSYHLAALARKLAELFVRSRPEIVLTLPYEGGHPDHDATAFAVHAAVELLTSPAPPRIIEMTSYHRCDAGCAYSEFLASTGDELVIQLSPEERAFKKGLFEIFRTQQKVLQWIPIGIERFRVAPRYEFSEPPHPGPLYFEQFPWGMTGVKWRALAGQALTELGLGRPELSNS